MTTRDLVKRADRAFGPALRFIVFGGILVLGATAPVQAQNGCTQGSLNGGYGYVLSGLQFPSPPSATGAGPVAAAGLIVFDGQGGLTARDTFNGGVTVSQRTGTGTYMVDSDCTGSSELGGDFGGLTFDLVIVSPGKELSLLVTNPGTVQPGIALTTGDEECSLASFNGTYRNVRTDYLIAGFFSVVNTGLEVATIDGEGNIVFPPVTQSRNGVFSHPTATGTYTVSSNCLIAFDLLVVDGTTSVRVHREGVVVDGGNQVWLVGATNPPSNAGTAQFKRMAEHPLH